MRLEDAEDLWLACVMQAPHYAKHSRVSRDHLSVRAKRILEEVIRVANEGWHMVEPTQLRGVTKILGSIPRRIVQIDAPTTIAQAESALIQAWARAFYAAKLQAAAKLCLSDGVEAAEAARIEAFREVEAQSAGVRWVSVGEAALDLHRDLSHLMNSPDRSNYIASGYPEIDEAVRYWQPECMTVIGSYTSEGKSTLTVQLLTGMAIWGTRVAYISLEDRPAIIATRQFANAIDDLSLVQQLTSGRPSQELLDEMLYLIHGDHERGGISALPMDVIYGRKYTIDRVCYAIQDAIRRGARVVGVDYLQQLKDKRFKRAEFLSECVSSMKSAASELGGHLVLVSQVVRPENKQKKERPTMYMLKETGDIENEAEYIALPFREEKGKEGPFENAWVFIDKAKDGRAPIRIEARWDTTRNQYSMRNTQGQWQ